MPSSPRSVHRELAPPVVFRRHGLGALPGGLGVVSGCMLWESGACTPASRTDAVRNHLDQTQQSAQSALLPLSPQSRDHLAFTTHIRDRPPALAANSPVGSTLHPE